MRRSTPALTANFYTHVLVADKAWELAKLPEMTITEPEIETGLMTGAEAVASLRVGENLEAHMDTRLAGLGGKIRGYAEDNRAVFGR